MYVCMYVCMYAYIHIYTHVIIKSYENKSGSTANSRGKDLEIWECDWSRFLLLLLRGEVPAGKGKSSKFTSQHIHYIHIHIYINQQVYTYMNKSIHMYVCMYAWIHTYIYIYTNIYIYIYTHTCRGMLKCVASQCVNRVCPRACAGLRRVPRCTAGCQLRPLFELTSYKLRPFGSKDFACMLVGFTP